MEAVADWITQGRFGILIYLGARYLYVINTAGQYERACELPADFHDRPIRIWDDAAGRWKLET